MSNQIISLSIPVNFSFEECLWFLDRNFDDCLHKVIDKQLLKAIEIAGRIVLVSITASDKELLIEVLNGPLEPQQHTELMQFVMNWFDLDKDLELFYQLIKKDQRLAYMATDYKGLRLIGIPGLFEAISWAVIGQQINLTFAYKLKRRLVEKYGSSVSYLGQKYYVFPDSKVLASANLDDLKEMQFSRSKAAYLINISAAFALGEISMEKLIAMPDLASRQKALISIKGIGIWTANYALMKSLKEHTAIPYGDSGLLNSLLNHRCITDKKQLQEIEVFFEGYKGWESYIVFYLWRSLAQKL